jgi:hypothetical protein
MQIFTKPLTVLNKISDNYNNNENKYRQNSCLKSTLNNDNFVKNCNLSFGAKIPKPKINLLDKNGQRIIDQDSFYNNFEDSIIKLQEIISDKTVKKELLKQSPLLELPVEIALFKKNDKAASMIINAFANEPEYLQKILVPGLLNKAIAFECKQTTKSILKLIKKHPDLLAKKVILQPDYSGRLPIEEALELGKDSLASSMVNLVKEQSNISIFTERGIINKAIEKGCKHTVDAITDITTKSPRIYFDMFVTKFPYGQEVPFNKLLTHSTKNAYKVFDSYKDYPDLQDQLISMSCADSKNAESTLKIIELINEKRAGEMNLYMPLLFVKNNIFLQNEFNNTFVSLSGRKKQKLIDFAENYMKDESVDKAQRLKVFNSFPLKTL